MWWASQFQGDSGTACPQEALAGSAIVILRNVEKMVEPHLDCHQGELCVDHFQWGLRMSMGCICYWLLRMIIFIGAWMEEYIPPNPNSHLINIWFHWSWNPLALPATNGDWDTGLQWLHFFLNGQFHLVTIGEEKSGWLCTHVCLLDFFTSVWNYREVTHWFRVRYHLFQIST